MMTLSQLMQSFPTEDSCREFLKARRWPKAVRCPRCQSAKHVYPLALAWHWECSNSACRTGNAYRFSITAGTIFENTKYPLRTWFEVLYTMLNSKKGVSAKQIERQIGSSYPTAWYLCHRLRAGMRDPEFKKLMGIVEVDETYLGGKDKNRHASKKQHIRGGSAKTTIIGAISRKGNVVCQMIADADAKTLDKFVQKAVSSKVDLIATDDYLGYNHLPAMGYEHGTVAHSRGECVRGKIHTQNMDSFWALLKRGILGTYHNVSKKYLPLYLAEFQFRYNNRENADLSGAAIAGC